MFRSCRLPPWAIALVLAVVLGQARLAEAGVITDPTGDFLPTYTGPKIGALDVISAGGTFDGTTYHLFAMLAGPAVSAPAGSSFVWGINKGGAPEVFVTGTPSVGAGVRFNAVGLIRPDGSLGGLATSGTVSGSNIDIFIPLSALPSTGFAPQDYTWNLWPRSGGGNALISDFAPDASNERFTLIPEPATLAVFGGIALAGALGYRRRKATASV